MNSRWTTALLILLVAALIAALAVLVLRNDNEKVSLKAGEPEVVSASQLSEVADQAKNPIYWLGEREGTDLEVTETASGRFYVRYLEGGAEAGDKRPDFLTVGTYPSKNGVAEIRQAATQTQGAELARTDNGAVLLIDPSSSRSAHLAFPGPKTPQIEVYSPVPGQALRLASRGAVGQVP